MATNTAQWGSRIFQVDPSRVVPLLSLSTGYARKSETNNDTSGQPTTNTRGLELQQFTLSTRYVAAVGLDPRAEIEAWRGEFENRYPLIEDWHWTRDDCIRAIQEAGLPLPGKSSCFFCPSMKRKEIEALKRQYPDLYRRALAIEENAMPHLKTVKGLGRNYAWKERYGME